MKDFELLKCALTRPRELKTFTLAQWDRLIPLANSQGVLGRICAWIEADGFLADIPEAPRSHLTSARLVAENEARVLRWEVNRLGRALKAIPGPIVLVKGAAYAMMELPVARGRIATDVDVLVPKTTLDEIERALLRHGWQHIKLEDYDQYYYRTWSHELPPLQHKDRGTVVDVHHTILPPTGRLHPDPEKLLAASLPMSGTIFRVLAPVDMVLHSAAHGFQDGDLASGLRDLVDIDGLVRHFSQEEKFWGQLLSRAEELQLSRPLFYALRYAQRYLDTPIPKEVLDRAQSWKPYWFGSLLMDRLVELVITASLGRDDWRVKLAHRLLYMRSHWLRMPPWLLAKHLLHQALRRWRRRKAA